MRALAVVVFVLGISTAARAQAPDPLAECLARRYEIAIQAGRQPDPAQRASLLATLPHCTAAEYARAPLPPPPHVRGFTFEIAGGLAELDGSGQTSFLNGIAGPDLGFGGFVTHDVALSLRVSGFAIGEGGLVYLGVIGPHVQVWLTPDVFVGAGLGESFVAGCAGGCDAAGLGLGYDARVGLAFARSERGAGHVALEVNTVSAADSPSLSSIAVVLGYQTF